MLQNDYQFMSLREMRLIAGVPIAEPSRITGEGRVHRRGKDKAGKYVVKKKKSCHTAEKEKPQSEQEEMKMNDAERFEQIFLSQVTRPGADKLLEWLKSTDFFTAPASTRFHGAYPGGLVKHSLNVYYALLGNFNLRGLYSPQTQTIVALLHDVCKANYYAGEYPDYTVKDQIPMGHGEKSVYLVMKHMELTDDEALAIRWHMGAYDDAFRGGSRALNAAMERTPLVLELHYADMIATQREKNEEVL